MDGWIKLSQNREITIYLWEENNSPCSGPCSVSKHKVMFVVYCSTKV